MTDVLLSVIIPARNEIYLQQTINSTLEAFEGNSEMIVVLDGYWPDPPIVDDPRVKLIHHTEAIGQRQSINEAARIAKGKYIFKTDAHVMFDKGFDVKLAADCEYDWTVIPRMYNLDRFGWQPKYHKLTDYMYIGCEDNRMLRAEYYKGSEHRRQHHKEALIDDVMCCMGCGWFMHKDRFWELGGCDETHGGWGQQGVEVSLKAWLSGGSLKVNKKTWFAHWFRGSDGGFPYKLGNGAIENARVYSRDLWLNNKWDKQTRKFEWLINKFDPPGWEKKVEQSKVDELNGFFIDQYHYKNKTEPTWKGIKLEKMPTDMILYHQIIWEKKPDFIIDVGTRYGGSSLFFADQMDLLSQGRVISIDINKGTYPIHPRITYLTGRSTSEEILKQVKEIVGDKSVMVILDSDHHRVHVKRELHYYSNIVTPGQYMVVEDCYDNHGKIADPGVARDWFVKNNKGFNLTDIDKQFIIGYSRGGWLLKR